MRQPPSSNASRRPAFPRLDEAGLRVLALRYVGRYATTRAKLAAYLRRKLDKAEWTGGGAPDVAGLVDQVAALGYVDDRAFAETKAAALGRRGYGARRVADAFRAAGVAAEDGRAALDEARGVAFTAALRLAERRRIGPFGPPPPDRTARERAIGILVRAGHDPAVARKIVSLRPEELDEAAAVGYPDDL